MNPEADVWVLILQFFTTTTEWALFKNVCNPWSGKSKTTPSKFLLKVLQFQFDANCVSCNGMIQFCQRVEILHARWSSTHNDFWTDVSSFGVIL
jgi:hypothetical protein